MPSSRIVKGLILPLFLAGALFVALIQAQNVYVGPPFGGLSRLVYRTAFFITLPMRAAIFIGFRPALRLGSWPELACGSLLTGYGLVALTWLALVIRRRRAKKNAEATANGEPRTSRRAFLVQSTFRAGAVGAAGLGGYTCLVAPQRLRVQRYELPVRDLPAGLDGLRIGHISDTHFGPFISQSYLEGVIRRANTLNADLFVLTGDYVHDTPRAIETGVGIFKDLRARLGTLAVLGNHDHWEGAGRCREVFDSIGIPLIENARRFITPKGLTGAPDSGDALCVGGVGDLWEDRVAPGVALRDVPDTMPRLMLSHNPDVAETLKGDHRVDLMLSGHTHGGQVDFPVLGTLLVPSRFGSKYAGGLCQGPRCRVLVSRAAGMALLPVRFRVPPEIGLITLRRDAGTSA